MWSGRPRPLPLTCLSREKGSRRPRLGKGASGKLREGTTREGHDFSGCGKTPVRLCFERARLLAAPLSRPESMTDLAADEAYGAQKEFFRNHFSRPLSPSKNQPRLEDVQIPSILSSRPEQIIAKR